jgi:hypothetical protein
MAIKYVCWQCGQKDMEITVYPVKYICNAQEEIIEESQGVCSNCGLICTLDDISGYEE